MLLVLLSLNELGGLSSSGVFTPAVATAALAALSFGCSVTNKIIHSQVLKNGAAFKSLVEKAVL